MSEARKYISTIVIDGNGKVEAPEPVFDNSLHGRKNPSPEITLSSGNDIQPALTTCRFNWRQFKINF
jgi:hypothetical protein